MEDLDKLPDEFELDVWQSDIDDGIQGDSYKCAIARAVGRRFDGAENIAVGNHAMIDYKGVRYLYYCEKAVSFIARFDEDRSKCKPTRFKYKKMEQPLSLYSSVLSSSGFTPQLLQFTKTGNTITTNQPITFTYTVNSEGPSTFYVNGNEVKGQLVNAIEPLSFSFTPIKYDPENGVKIYPYHKPKEIAPEATVEKELVAVG